MKKFPTAFTILFALIVVVAALTWIIPAGQYERAFSETLGREAPAPGAGWLLGLLAGCAVTAMSLFCARPALNLGTGTHPPRGLASRGVLILAAFIIPFASPSAPSAQTLERARETGVVRLGYRPDARPFSFPGTDGAPAGYSVELCRKIVEAIGAEVGREVSPEYVQVSTEERFRAIAEGKVDLLCSADTVTLGRRETVSFTIPIYLTGISALLSANAPRELSDVIAGEASQPSSRSAIQQAMRRKTFGVRSGTTAETWLNGYVARYGGTAEVVAVADHAEGVAGVASGTFDAYFADRALLLGQLQAVGTPERFTLSDRLFTFEPYAIGLARGDEDLRLVADRTLSRFFASPEYLPFFRGFFGAPDNLEKLFLTIAAIPD